MKFQPGDLVKRVVEDHSIYPKRIHPFEHYGIGLVVEAIFDHTIRVHWLSNGIRLNYYQYELTRLTRGGRE